MTSTQLSRPPAPDDRVDACLVWLRRDLRLADHRALAAAMHSARTLFLAFVFDRAILDALPRSDRRVEFLRESVAALDQDLRELARSSGVEGARLIVLHDIASSAIPKLAQTLRVQRVVASHDDDPYALARDASVQSQLADLGIALHTVKDHVVFERREVLTAAGSPFSVFTPYKNAWLKRLQPADLDPAPSLLPGHGTGRLGSVPSSVSEVGAWPAVPTLADLGFAPTNLATLRLPAGEQGGQRLFADFLQRIDAYGDTRNFPAVKGPSYLSVHLRFGTVSIRHLAREAWQRMQGGSRGAEVWLSELIWRDFYHQVLHHHPHVQTQAFRPEYDRIAWETGSAADELFSAWCEGRTGYPLVDAAMAQINQTGYMHNRLRMVVASFLTKDLGLDWRRGEAYFATHLLDFDLAANNGGWQWAASSGCDAQPYFRIFNPVSQSEKFDPEGRFIRRYLPALKDLPGKAVHAPWLAKPVEIAASGLRLGRDYPAPVVAHDVARLRTLARYAVVKKGAAV